LQPRTAAAEVIRQFDEGKSNKHIKPYQTIFHPGEVRTPSQSRQCQGHSQPVAGTLSLII